MVTFLNFRVLDRDKEKSRLERLEWLEPCSIRDLEPNQNLTAVVRTVRDSEEASDLTKILTNLTKNQKDWLDDKTLINQHSNQPNQPNQEKIDGGAENAFFEGGDYEEF